MSAQEDENTIQPWRQSNQFTLTFRGHWSGIPEPSDTVLLSDYDPYEIDSISPQIRELTSNENYNTLYDSFYAPVDFQLSGIAFKVADFLPQGVSYRIRIKVNESQLELVEIPNDEDHNQKKYSMDCSTIIYEDDFVEIDIRFSGDASLLTFNRHNITFSISGCTWYGMYKSIYADEVVNLATTEEIVLSGVQTIDGVLTEVDDVVVVKDQTVIADDGLWVVQSGAWTRHIDYPTLASLDGIIIHVLYGDTQNSTDETNYVFTGGGLTAAEIPLIEWHEGDAWYKGSVYMQNRSGNETLTDRVVLDSVKCAHNFLIQGLSLSTFKDNLVVIDRMKIKEYCFYIDILVNGNSILPPLGFPRPLAIDANENMFSAYDIEVFNDIEGYPVRFGDVLSMVLYQRNPYLRSNGNIIQCSVYGCGPDCASLDSSLVSVYEPCDDAPCTWKYIITDKCDPFAAKLTRKDLTVNVTVPTIPSVIG